MNPNNQLLSRGVAEIIDANRLKKRLASGEKLRVKLGVDTNKPDLHIGHMVPLRKLREFQESGHTAILILGDYTAQLGDPSDRSEARKLISSEETRKNAEAYLDQVFTILDEAKTEVRHNSEWFNTFTLREVIELMASVTVNHLLSHETFSQRLENNQSLHFQELLYPLLQGYDSVMVKADIELGGIDQKFNVLMGRTLQRINGQPEQDIMLFPYLPGVDGQAKMSKSLGNTINLTDMPNDMFGKVMSIPDNLIPIYLELATTMPQLEIDAIKKSLADPKHNPRDSKVMLAKQIVREYYSNEIAEKAAQEFETIFRKGGIPEDIETLKLAPMVYELVDVLASRSTLVPSKSEVRRLIAQKGIKKNGQVIEDPTDIVSPKDGEEIIIQVGSRRFLRIIWLKK